jgi:hypothetical protein
MIVVVGRNEKHVVPDFVLPNLVLHRLAREHQADAGAVFHVQSVMVAVVNLKLQIPASRNAQRIAGRPRLGQMPREIYRRYDIQIARGLTGNPAAVRRGATIVNDRRLRAEM